MRLLILGASGVGKGTQAKIIAKEFGINHIATGDWLREEIKKDTALCRAVGRLIDQGYLVPDELMLSILYEIIHDDDFILDGYPRTLRQAQELDALCNSMNKPIDVALNITVPDEDILQRITGRKVCPSCNEIYHKTFKPSVVFGFCDNCGTKLIQRVDDTLDTVRNRLKIYHSQFEPILDFYEKKSMLISISGVGKSGEISKNLIALLKEKLVQNGYNH